VEILCEGCQEAVQGEKMKALVVYYSRTGTTRKAAKQIAENLKCDIEEIIDKKDRSGAMVYVTGGRDAMKKLPTEIGPIKKDPSQYDLVIIGTPVWAWTITPAIRTYLAANKVKKAAFFVTMTRSGDKGSFQEMERITGLKPQATMALIDKEVNKGDVSGKIKEFTDRLERWKQKN
jgi:flavodoxin